MRKIFANGTDENVFLAELNKRAGETNKKVTETVSAIIDDVRENGDEAVKNYTLKFDGNLPQYYEVPREVINDALTEADQNFVDALLNAQENIADFHNRQVVQGFRSYNFVTFRYFIRTVSESGDSLCTSCHKNPVNSAYSGSDKYIFIWSTVLKRRSYHDYFFYACYFCRYSVHEYT